ncbi:MAG TPA: HAD hydrolase-like protein [Sediminibacterium sp.]|nr:HAD hydrolase-like protein [Sediminibacterium sp.]HQS56479.1 HAD hydrolase-like protein [Sediminibacterium sp.]
MTYELVVFDMAGTTVKDNGNVNDAFRAAFLESGIDVLAADVDTVMGYRKVEAIEIILKKYLEAMEYDAARINLIHDSFTANMVSFYENSTELAPLPQVMETFSILKAQGYKIALNTGFTRVITDVILKRLGWLDNHLIDAVVCSDEVQEGRPHPFMIRRIMDLVGVTESAKVVKVGDTSVDVLEGQFAGCGLVVAVTTGAYTKEQLMEYQPDKIIDSMQDLPALIA